jgi:hypothetical protein
MNGENVGTKKRLPATGNRQENDTPRAACRMPQAIFIPQLFSSSQNTYQSSG